MNLFLSTRAMTDAREDHLTEFFAAALHLFPQFRDAYYDLTLATYCRANGWDPCEISSIDTQHCYDDASCRPDMLITLSNGKLIACEHKLDAVETLGPESDDRRQLERYLDLPIDGLLFIRASWKPPGRHVLKHPKYIKPNDREHFLWRDFYPLLEASTDPFLLWIKEGFERLGFTPPHPQIGELKEDTDRHNFAKLWSKVRSYAHSLGWEPSAGAIVQLYLNDNDRSCADFIFIQPTATGFQFRVTPKEKQRDHCFASLASVCNATPTVADHGVKWVRRQEGKVAVYDIELPATAILGKGELSVAETEDRLYRFVAPFLNAVQNPVA
jgi:hypothetical protein